MPDVEAARIAATLDANPPGRFLDMCVGMHHTCAVEETVDVASGNITGTALRCWGSNYSSALDVGAVTHQLSLFADLRGGVALCKAC